MFNVGVSILGLEFRYVIKLRFLMGSFRIGVWFLYKRKKLVRIEGGLIYGKFCDFWVWVFNLFLCSMVC